MNTDLLLLSTAAQHRAPARQRSGDTASSLSLSLPPSLSLTPAQHCQYFSHTPHTPTSHTLTRPLSYSAHYPLTHGTPSPPRNYRLRT
mmetsp:Transcript_26995/g.60474  ORF Transcript_26995/g.60474 Transcript_26995/m.60474 type:complete len:88 (-) Transcript_26995:25-288(-)